MLSAVDLGFYKIMSAVLNVSAIAGAYVLGATVIIIVSVGMLYVF